ncbi:MAG: 8-amino-7-oxononanoate synthase [Bacteroides sp.]|nr:8-amino-7-oxononanoate synthase [Bacteroides sp.]
MPELSEILKTLLAENRLRSIPGEPSEGMIDLSSNDYMSLGKKNALFMPEFIKRFPDAPFTSSASRLLSARQKYHTLLEDYLSSLYGKETLLFNSGYHANVGCISALTLPSTLFVCDKLVHASIIDGLRMAGSKFVRFQHNDVSRLTAIIEKDYDNFDRIVIVTESIFSMDGDEAPIKEIVNLKKRFPRLFIYLDEAHAFGVRGEKGLGVSEEKGIIDSIDLLVGTFGKAGASAGAFIATTDEVKQFMINTARPFIFSTALPPANVAWSLMMVEKLVTMNKEREKLAELSRKFSERITQITGKPTGSSSQIIPFHTGNAARALEVADKLRENGFIALPIRRPTVPPGAERIRFSLACDMKFEQFHNLFKILEEL